MHEGKIENARTKQENDDLKAKNDSLAKDVKDVKDKLKASKDDKDSDEDLDTGHNDDNPDSPSKLIARLKK